MIEYLVEPRRIRELMFQCVDEAEEVHLASAWLRKGWPLNLLMGSSCKVHSLIGTSFGLTDPEVLTDLSEKGRLRIVPDSSPRLFHPKMYLFKSAALSRAIIGSANLTNGAFLNNAEACVCTNLHHDEYDMLLGQWTDWFDDLGREVTPDWLKTYVFKSRRSAQRTAEIADAEDLKHSPRLGDMVLPEILALTWPEYYDRIHSRTAILDGGLEIYLRTIRDVQPFVLSGLPDDFDSPRANAIRGLLPRGSEPDYGPLGRLRANGSSVRIFQDKSLRKLLDSLLPEIHDAQTDSDAISLGKELWDVVLAERYLGPAVASRLLTLANPGRFFSANGKSIPDLSKFLGIATSRLKEWRGYSEALMRLWSSSWFNSACPTRDDEAEAWASRVALVDALVYSP